MGGMITTQDRAFFALFYPLLSFASIFYLPSSISLCSPSTVVLVSGVAVKRNRELLDGRWDKHDTKDAANIADLISQWVSPDHPRLWPGHFGQGDRRPGQPLPLSKPEAGAQAGRLGFERRSERENLGFGDPGYFQKGQSRSALCPISLNFKTWIRDDGCPPWAGYRILIEFTLSLSKG
jgi:hypothetical protein